MQRRQERLRTQERSHSLVFASLFAPLRLCDLRRSVQQSRVPDREIPVRETRLGEVEPGRDPAPYVWPIAGAILVMGLLMMLCSPLTALQLRSVEMPAEVAAMPADERPPPPMPDVIDIVAVIIFFCLGTLGMVGGLMGLAKLEWGRKLMIAFAVLALLYGLTTIGYRLSGGLTDLFDSVPVGAPRRSALGAFFFWTVVPLAFAAFVLVQAIRYLTRRHVKRVFRRVRFVA